jgi:hypothetical protein
MLVIATLLAAAAYHPEQTTSRIRLRAAAIAGLAFLSAGFSETAVVLQLGLLALAGGMWLLDQDMRRSKEMGWLLLAGIAGTLIGLTVMAVAPGNAFRQAFFPPPPALPELLKITGISFLKFITIYLPVFWEGSLPRLIHRWLDLATPWTVFALMGSGLIIGNSVNATSPKYLLFFWLTPLICAGLVFACFMPAAYGMSTSMPGRAFIIPVFAANVGSAIWGYACGLALCRLGAVRLQMARWQLAAAGILLLLGLNSLWSAGLTLKTQPAYAAYTHAWMENDGLIAEQKPAASGPIILEPVVNPVFGFSELTSDPNNFINQCMSGYYGVELRTTAPPVP